MNRSSILASSAAIAFTCATTPAVSLAADSSADSLEELIVTARRVEENQQSVPVAVTTLTASALEQQNVNSVTDIQFSVPNLQIKPSTSYPSQPEFIIRGQRQVLLTDENVVTYVNNVPQSTRGLTLYDLESVQSLKGPQGTLFGKNSMGGAMVFTTKRPTDVLEGGITLEAGNYDLQKAVGVLNVPLAADVAAVRFAGQLERRDGIFKNSFPGMKDLADRDHKSARASLLLTPSDSFENLLTLDYLERDETPFPAVIEASDPAQGLGALYSQVVAAQSQLGGSTAVMNGNLLMRTGDPFDVSKLTGIGTTIPGTSFINTYGSSILSRGLSNSSIYEINSNLSVKNIVGARYEKSIDQTDPGGSSGIDVVIGLNNNTPVFGQFVGNNINYLNRVKSVSEELQLIGEYDSFKFITGAFYSHSNLLYSVNSYLAIGPTSLYPLGPRHAQAVTKSDSYALFGQGTYDFTNMGVDGLRLTAGIRRNEDRRDYYSENFFTARNDSLQRFSAAAGDICNEFDSSSNGVTSVNDGVNCSIAGKQTYRAWTWTASLEYQTTPDTLAYLATRRGHKAGSPNPTTRNQQFAFFGSEQITDYELGLKHQGYIGDSPYRVNVAAFYGDYKDIQSQDILTFCTDSTQSGNCGGNTYTDLIVLNLGKATIKGIELDGSIKPIRDLTLDVGYSYQKGKYGSGSVVPQPATPLLPISDSNPINFAGGTDLGGKEFAGVPRTTFNASAVYSASFIPETFATTALSVNYSYRSDTKGLPVQGIFGTPSFGLWNARLSLDDVAGTAVSVSLWSQNLTNKEYKLYCSDNINTLGYSACYWGEPRTYGLSLGYKF